MVRPFPHTTAVSGQHAPLAPQFEAAAHGEPGFVGFNSASHQRQQKTTLPPTRGNVRYTNHAALALQWATHNGGFSSKAVWATYRASATARHDHHHVDLYTQPLEPTLL